jgi:hypothetical protein
MGPEIVWRNPVPPPTSERRVEPVVVDELGVIYAVRTIESTAVFELFLSRVA